jgi:peptidoglycan/xylan/chitin deacetylase (PgdA/CDA1 family)
MHIDVTLRPIAVAFALTFAAGTAMAADCKPGALGTGRTIVVDPTEHGRIGTMQYGETLPLRDHEVVLTFDDGPIPPNTTKVLDILAAECVKATFFLVGTMANRFPSVVRRTYDEGHTIATHTQTHSAKIWKWPIPKQEADIQEGIASVTEALGESGKLSPFFRFPGLGNSAEIESHLAAQGIMVWSADFPADDWTRITAKQVMKRALDRLERRGKGVLLLHDIHKRTVTALPELLMELKKRNYTVVHVVAAGPDRPKTDTDPQQWVMQTPPVKPATPAPAKKRNSAAEKATAAVARSRPLDITKPTSTGVGRSW